MSDGRSAPEKRSARLASTMKIAAAAGAVVALTAPAALAFIFIRYDAIYSYNKGSRSVAHAPKWANKTVTFYLNKDLTALGGGAFPAQDFTASDLETWVQTVVSTWNSVNCKTGLTVKYGGSTSATLRLHRRNQHDRL